MESICFTFHLLSEGIYTIIFISGDNVLTVLVWIDLLHEFEKFTLYLFVQRFHFNVSMAAEHIQ